MVCHRDHLILKKRTFLHSWITASGLCDPEVKTSRSITGISIGMFVGNVWSQFTPELLFSWSGRIPQGHDFLDDIFISVIYQSLSISIIIERMFAVAGVDSVARTRILTHWHSHWAKCVWTCFIFLAHRHTTRHLYHHDQGMYLDQFFSHN